MKDKKHLPKQEEKGEKRVPTQDDCHADERLIPYMTEGLEVSFDKDGKAKV